MKKKILALLLALFVMLPGTVSAYAADLDTVEDSQVEPRYQAITRVTASLSFHYGLAYATSTYRVKSLDDYDYELTLTLESSTDKIHWTEVTSWTTTLTSTDSTFSKQRAVASGYYYRTVATLDAYTKDGDYIETSEIESLSVYY